MILTDPIITAPLPNWNKKPDEENLKYRIEREILHDFVPDDEYIYPDFTVETTDEPGSSLAEKMAYRVLSKYNKHVTCMIEGETGSGKSHTALALAQGCAEIISKRTGKPADHYFNFEHVGIIDPKMIEEQLMNMKKHGIYIFDDAGAGIGARDFMSQMNRYLGKIIQTCRTSNSILIFTVPSGDLIDKIFREICRYRIEIINPVHRKGITFMKVFIQQKNSRKNMIYWKRITTRGKLVSMWYVRAIEDKQLLADYEKARALNAFKIANKEEIVEKKEEKVNRLQEEITLYGDSIIACIKENVMISRGKLSAAVGSDSVWITERVANNMGYYWQGMRKGWIQK